MMGSSVLALLSPLTVLGAVWTVATFYLLYTEKGCQLSSRRELLLLSGPLMLLSVFYVASEVDVIRVLAGGVDPLDVHYGYTAVHISQLAEALGDTGRRTYAAFQLGADTLAPPAFACFILNVSRSSVSFPAVRKVLTVVISIYFISVLAANTLMPLVMISYPEKQGFVGALYVVVPILDLIKYSIHALGWLIIVSSWLGALCVRMRRQA